jgi:putative serine protease PepD
MTQTADSRPDQWRAPWATPAAGGDSPPSAPQPDQPYSDPAQPYAAQPQQRYGRQPADPYAPHPSQATQQIAPPSGWPPPSGRTGAPSQSTPLWPPPQPSGAGPGAPTDPTANGRREPRRPGWGGVVAMGAGAAVLSSLLTAGIITSRDDTAATTSTASSNGGSSGSGSSSQVAIPPVSSGNVTSPKWGDVAAAVEPSVVTVKVTGQACSGEGSGIVLDSQGRVLTNNHVVADAAGGGSIQVVLSDGRTYDASVVGTDSSTDLAVIKLSGSPSGLKSATFGDSTTVKVGDAVMAVGNPLGLSETVTTGIVSAVDRPVTTSASDAQSPLAGGGSGENVVTNAIQTDAAVNPGNSGGALVDSRGRVIGITSSIASLGSSAGSQSGSIGLGFAIPINTAKDVADQLIKTGTAQHAFLGVSLSEGTITADGAKRQAALLQSVTSGEPAAKAGLKQGDAVIAIDGEAVSGADSLVAQIRERKPGAVVSLTVVRNGSTQKISVTLGTHPTTTQ